MRLKRILIIGTIFPVLFSIVLFFGILISGEDDDNSNSYSPVYSGMNLSADVLKHQPMVEKYARENGISKKRTMEKRTGNIVPMIRIRFNLISSVLSLIVS